MAAGDAGRHVIEAANIGFASVLTCLHTPPHTAMLPGKPAAASWGDRRPEPAQVSDNNLNALWTERYRPACASQVD